MNAGDITYAQTVIAREEIAMNVLAHQGGWDELLLIAVPIVIIVGLLAVVKRRVERAAAKVQSMSEPSISSDSSTDIA